MKKYPATHILKCNKKLVSKNNPKRLNSQQHKNTFSINRIQENKTTTTPNYPIQKYPLRWHIYKVIRCRNLPDRRTYRNTPALAEIELSSPLTQREQSNRLARPPLIVSAFISVQLAELSGSAWFYKLNVLLYTSNTQ